MFIAKSVGLELLFQRATLQVGTKRRVLSILGMSMVINTFILRPRMKAERHNLCVIA